MPSPPPSSDAKPTGNGNSDGADPTPSPVPTIAKRKLRKIPPIPARRGFAARPEKEGEEEEEDEDEEEEEEEDGRDTGVEDPSSPILPSSLGLNHIRTKSTPPPLHFPSLEPETPKAKDRDGDAGKDPRPVDHASALPLYTSLLMGAGKKSSWIQSKSLKGRFVPHPEIEGHQVTFDIAKGIQSPRFQAILRVTSGRRKRTADIKSFSHELNSKGVRPYPIWKPRGLSHPEEIMVIVSSKFHYLKEEVNSDLAVFAGDLVGILEKIAETHPEWKETLEDLLVEARHCAIMSPTEFWSKCEGIVQKLDDRRQELPTGTLKQLHARILFILTRCTRLIHYYKEGILAAEEHILGFHQLSDLGVYSEQVLGGENQGMKSSINGKDAKEKLTRKPHEQEPFLSDCDTAKSVDSTTSRERISSWKRLPSPAERNQKKKGHIIVDTLTKKTSDKMKVDSLEHTEDLNRPEFPSEVLGNPSDSLSKPQKLRCSYWEDQQNTSDECSIICRICEVEIPTVRVEDHSRVCTIADRCDLKGLSVNQRLLRVAESLEKILHSCTLRSSDAEGIGSPEIAKSSTSSVAESPDGPSPKGNNLSRGCSSDMIDCLPEDDNSSIMDDFKNFPSMSCKTNSPQMPDQLMSSSSSGSITPYCPQSTLTPRTKYINVLLSERHTIIDHEDFQQMKDLVNIAHKIANVNTSSSSEYLLACLEDLQDVVQDRNIDALIVETFGRRIEKLLREKYLQLCDHVDDGKIDSLSITGDEDGLIEEDIVHSLRVSAAISNCKDRTSIEDFEIIKPISRGAFGRVFLAKKRITGDLFAIKVLKKADTIRKNAVESILAERNILMTVHNPFVVRFFFSFTCRENLYLVMEYLNGGDLYSLLRNLGCLEEEMARVYIAEVVLALEYLHSLSIVHRDLKPDNLLIAKNGHIKLTDFGLSQVGLIGSTDDLSGPIVSSSAFLGNEESTLSSEQQMQKREERQKHSAVGTPDYLAPEILLGMGHGTSADWWSVGIILFELLVGIPPFNAEHPQKIFDNIMNRDIPWPNVPEEMSYEAYDLIDKLLSENPMQRLGATGAKEVKQHPFFKDINWDTLARQKATFIPSAEDEQDTSYFMSRYMWNPSDEFVHDDTTETGSGSCCSSSLSNQLNEEDDQCSNLTDFGANTIAAKNYSFSNFSFKNLSQLASINIDLAEKSCRDMPKASKPPIP